MLQPVRFMLRILYQPFEMERSKDHYSEVVVHLFFIFLQLLDGKGLMLWLFAGPAGVYLLDFSCSCIQFYLLLGPYVCFISFLYLDLYVLFDDALIS